VVERAGAWLLSLSARVWLTTVGVILIIAALTAMGSAVSAYLKSGTKKPAIARPVGPVAPETATAAVPVRKTTGRLQVSSQPPVARVLVDGTFRGMTPLTLDDLKPGQHAIVVDSAEGSVSRTVTIDASAPVVLEESIFSGWLAVYSPVDLVVREGAKAYPLDDRHQIMLPPGPHALHLENRALGYDEARQVYVKPGETLTLQVTPPRSALTVKATVDAQVFVDGALAGDTPLVAFSVALGTHEVVVKRAGDERRFVVTSTVKPLDLSVDFSKPAA
jgi:PEGA domain